MAQKGGLPRFVPNKPCAERASACQARARACTGAEGFIHSEESVQIHGYQLHLNLIMVGPDASTGVAPAAAAVSAVLGVRLQSPLRCREHALSFSLPQPLELPLELPFRSAAAAAAS